MTPISVVIITYNEQKNIKRCLESVKEIADEIVVVDSFFADKTEEMCAGYNVRVVKHKSAGHIELKNWAITQVNHPVVLSLEAEEALSKELAESILLAKNNWDADGYSMNRLTDYCGKWIKHCGCYPATTLRLWDSRKGRWGGVEQCHKVDMGKSATIKHLKGDLLHYSYYSISEHVNQIQTLTDISSREEYIKGKNISPLMILLRIPFTFINKYFFKLGVLDGYYGFVLCVLATYNIFLKDIKLRELNKTKKL